MKSVLIYVVFACFLFSCQAKSRKTTEIQQQVADTVRKAATAPYSFTFYDTSGALNVPDKKLKDSWKAFAMSVQSGNYDSIKKLSAGCISCGPCYSSDPPLKNSTDLVTMKGGGLPFEFFFRNEYKECFDGNLITRMRDSTKVLALYDVPGAGNYLLPCILRSANKNKPMIVEFLITTTDKSEMFPEGGAIALAFVETTTGYKFCGYSTFP